MVKIALAIRRTRKCDQSDLRVLQTPIRIGVGHSFAIAAISSALMRGTGIHGTDNERSLIMRARWNVDRRCAEQRRIRCQRLRDSNSIPEKLAK
jgi:hypothetical protein